jgi:hypothetical protein
MELAPLTKLILIAAVLLFILRLSLAMKGRSKERRRGVFRGGPGTGGAGAFYEMLGDEKRKAIEIIVEDKAAARDEETADDVVEPPEPDKR